MATIEITCPHCKVQTYVTFVRQTGNGSCPECGNEVADVFKHASTGNSGAGSMLTSSEFSDSGATIIAAPADRNKPGTAPLELSFGDFDGARPTSLPMLDPTSAPIIVPAESSPMLAPSQSAPSLMPSNSAPTLIPSGLAAPAGEGTLLTPPPPRLRQFSNEDRAAAKSFNRAAGEDTLLLGSTGQPAGSKRSTATLARKRPEPTAFAERAENDAPTRPTLPPVPVSTPARKSTASLPGVRRPTAPIPVSTRRPTGSVSAAAPTANPPMRSVAKPPVRRPTAPVGASAFPTREIVRPAAPKVAANVKPAAPRRPTAPISKAIVDADAAGPEELSLITPPPVKPTGTRVAAPASRKPTASVTKTIPQALGTSDISLFTPPPAKAAPSITGTRIVARPPAGNTRVQPPRAPATRSLPPAQPITASAKAPTAGTGGKSYPPIRAPGAPPQQTLSVVNLGEAPRLAPPPKPKDFGKKKYDASLTRLGYTLAGSDVSHFDLPEPSPVPFGLGPDSSAAEEPAAPPPPRARVNPPPKPRTGEVVEEAIEDEPAAGVDVGASVVSQANIEAGWADEGPNSGILGKIDLPDDDSLDDVAQAAVDEEEEEEAPTEEEFEGDEEFRPEGETRKLPTGQKADLPPKGQRRPIKQLESDELVIRRHAKGRYDSEVFWTRVLVGLLYVVCTAGALGFGWLMYKVHVLKEPLF